MGVPVCVPVCVCACVCVRVCVTRNGEKMFIFVTDLYLFPQDSRKGSVEKLQNLSSYASVTSVAERKVSGKLEDGNLRG